MKQRSNPDIAQLLLEVGGAIVLLLVIKDMLPKIDLTKMTGDDLPARDPNTGRLQVPKNTLVSITGASYTPILRSGSGMQVDVDFQHRGPSTALYMVANFGSGGLGGFGENMVYQMMDQGQWVGADADWVSYRSSLNQPLNIGPGSYGLVVNITDSSGRKLASSSQLFKVTVV